MVNPFAYSQNIISALERSLSSERLSTYLAAAKGDHAAALRLYIWNTEVSAALYGPCKHSKSSFATLFTASFPPSTALPGTTIRVCR
jgi:hypothetical protein